jgi:multidrug efflux pump subunit AcrA (membrane-fusion protein)
MTRLRLVLAAAALAGSALAGCQSSDDDEPIAPLEAIAPPARNARGDERSDAKPGFIAVLIPRQIADAVAPYTSARVSLQVKLGDTATKGQVLARLDDTQLRQELDAARAQHRTARADITRAVVEHRGAVTVQQRERKAVSSGVGAAADLANAEQAVAKASAAIEVARATAEERNTRIKQLQTRLQEMTLVASIAGSVSMIYPQDGARVEEGQPVIRIISGGVYVKFAIPVEQAGLLKPGDAVELRLDRRAEPLAATISHVSPELDAVAQMIIADADLVNPPADLQPGTVGRIVPRPR